MHFLCIFREYQLRHCAVLGFVEILCSVRLDNIASLSQNTNSQDSWPGLFTQVIKYYNTYITFTRKVKTDLT